MKLERNEIGMKREVFFLSCHVPVFGNSIKKKKKKNSYSTPYFIAPSHLSLLIKSAHSNQLYPFCKNSVILKSIEAL